MHRLWLSGLVVIVVLASVTPSCLGRSGLLLHLSDIHLDVYGYYCSQQPSQVLRAASRVRPDFTLAELASLQNLTGGIYGSYGCDTQPELLASLGAELRKLVTTPVEEGGYGETFDGVLLSGDYVGHGIVDPEAMIKAIATVEAMLVESLGGEMPIYFVIGNNDVPGDYNASCNDPFYATIAEQGFYSRIPIDQEASWAQRASYYVDEPFGAGSGRIVALNTVLYAARNPNAVDLGNDPCGQLQWLNNTLASAVGPLLLLGHIAPGIDSFSNSMMYSQPMQSLDLTTSYLQGFQYGFFGHQHTDEFRVASDGAQPLLFLQSSVSPIFGGNPSFRVLHYSIDDEAAHYLFEDYDQYYFDLPLANERGVPQWKREYSFASAYNQTACTPTAYDSLWHQLTTSTATYDLWWSHVYSDSNTTSTQPRTGRDQLLYLCAQVSLNLEEQQRCADLLEAH